MKPELKESVKAKKIMEFVKWQKIASNAHFLLEEKLICNSLPERVKAHFLLPKVDLIIYVIGNC